MATCQHEVVHPQATVMPLLGLALLSHDAHLPQLALLVPPCCALPAPAVALLQLATALRSPELALLVLVMLMRLASLKRTPGPRERDAASLKLATRLVRRLGARLLPSDAAGCGGACPSAGACTSHIQACGLCPVILSAAVGPAHLLEPAQVTSRSQPTASAQRCCALQRGHAHLLEPAQVTSRSQPTASAQRCCALQRGHAHLLEPAPITPRSQLSASALRCSVLYMEHAHLPAPARATSGSQPTASAQQCSALRQGMPVCWHSLFCVHGPQLAPCRHLNEQAEGCGRAS